MNFSVIKNVELDNDMPVQKAYLYVDGIKSFGPLSTEEVTTLITIMKKFLITGEFSQELPP